MKGFVLGQLLGFVEMNGFGFVGFEISWIVEVVFSGFLAGLGGISRWFGH